MAAKKSAKKSQPPTSSPESVEVAVVSVAANTNDVILALKEATQTYASSLRLLCPKSAHAALEAKLEHVRANAVLAIEGR